MRIFSLSCLAKCRVYSYLAVLIYSCFFRGGILAKRVYVAVDAAQCCEGSSPCIVLAAALVLPLFHGGEHEFGKGNFRAGIAGYGQLYSHGVFLAVY